MSQANAVPGLYPTNVARLSPTVTRSLDPNDPSNLERQRAMDADVAIQLSRARSASLAALAAARRPSNASLPTSEQVSTYAGGSVNVLSTEEEDAIDGYDTHLVTSGPFRATGGQLFDGEHVRGFDFPDQSLVEAISKADASSDVHGGGVSFAQATGPTDRHRLRTTSRAWPLVSVGRVWVKNHHNETSGFQEDPTLQRIYRLHPLHRHALCVRLAWESQQRLHKGIRDGKPPIDTDLYTAIHLFSRVAPISRMPREIQEEILLVAIQTNGHSPANLMQVCRLWRNIMVNKSRLWSSLKVGSWTAQEPVESKLERSREWPLEVEINTKDEPKDDADPSERYKALSIALKTMSRWKSLKLVAFSAEENSTAIHSGDGPALQLIEPLCRLESFVMLDQCPSSPFVDTLLSTVSTTSKDHLKCIQVPCPSIISRITGHSNCGILKNLTTLKVYAQSTNRVTAASQPLDLLPHLKQVEVLELTSMVFPDYQPDVILPLVKTLRQLTLKATSIQWLFGRTLSSLLSCTIIYPLRTERPDHEKISLPSCEELLFYGHPNNALRHLLLPKITKLGVRNDECTKKRANQQFDWIRSGLRCGQFQGITVLSIDLIGFSETFLELLAHVSLLREFTLRMTTPTGISCKVLRKLCANPLIRPVGEHWCSRSKKMGPWQASLWPLLTTLRMEFGRWFRDTEQEEEDIVPGFAAIAWTRNGLDNPLQHFEIRVGEHNKDNPPLELVGGSSNPLRAFGLNGPCDYVHSKEAPEAVVTSVVLSSIEIKSQDTLRFFLQLPCRSVLRNLRSLKLHHSASNSPRDPINVLPYFERLNVLEAHGLHTPTYTLGTNLMLVRTLKRLSLRDTSIQWMIGRRFEKLEECSIWNPAPASFTEAHGIEMPVCTCLLFGDRTLEHLGLFRLPSVAKLALVSPWFPDIPSLASRWIKDVESISETIKVTSLQMEANICDSTLIDVLWLQPRLEELVLRVWGYDSLVALSSAFVIDSDVQRYKEDSKEGSGSGDDTIMTGRTTETVVPFCPQLHTLELKLENVDYEKKRGMLLPLCKMILGSRRSKGRPLQSLKISCRFGGREEQLVL